MTRQEIDVLVCEVRTVFDAVGYVNHDWRPDDGGQGQHIEALPDGTTFLLRASGRVEVAPVYVAREHVIENVRRILRAAFEPGWAERQREKARQSVS
jgi:hypothetical protein